MPFPQATKDPRWFVLIPYKAGAGSGWHDTTVFAETAQKAAERVYDAKDRDPGRPVRVHAIEEHGTDFNLSQRIIADPVLQAAPQEETP